MDSNKQIKAVVGQPVQIKLQSMAGSTGYSWYLTKVDGLALSSAVLEPTAPGIAPINHVFDFLACEAGKFTVEFELKAPWRAQETADTETFEVEIKAPAKTAKDEIENALEGRSFIKASAANVGSQIEASKVVKYAAPMSSTVGNVPQTMILYAAPITNQGTGLDSGLAGTLSAATMIAYAAPTGPSTVAVANRPDLVALQAAQLQAMQQPAIDPCLQGAMCPQPLYAAPMPYPPIPPYAAPIPFPPQPVYAAPTAMMPYAAPITLRYAAPMPIQPYAAPITLRYAAPMSGCC